MRAGLAGGSQTAHIFRSLFNGIKELKQVLFPTFYLKNENSGVNVTRWRTLPLIGVSQSRSSLPSQSQPKQHQLAIATR